MVMTANALLVVFGTAPLITVTRKWKAVTNVGLSSLLYAAGFGILYFGRTVGFFLGTAVIWTAGEILSATNVDVYIANHTPASHRGRMNAISPILVGAGFAVSPMIMGRFIERFGTRMVWPLAAVLGLISTAGFVLLRIADGKNVSRRVER